MPDARARVVDGRQVDLTDAMDVRDHIGLDPHGHSQGDDGTGRLLARGRKSFDALPGAGAQVLQEVNDVGGGKLVASVKDADGDGIGLIQPAS